MAAVAPVMGSSSSHALPARPPRFRLAIRTRLSRKVCAPALRKSPSIGEQVFEDVHGRHHAIDAVARSTRRMRARYSRRSAMANGSSTDLRDISCRMVGGDNVQLAVRRQLFRCTRTCAAFQANSGFVDAELHQLAQQCIRKERSTGEGAHAGTLVSSRSF